MTALTVDSVETTPGPARRDLWFTRWYYLLWFGGSAIHFPFLNLFYLELGLTGAEIGWIGSMAAIVTLTTAPFWTSRSARWNNPRAMLQLFLIISAVTFFLLSQQVAFLGIAIIAVFRAFMTSSLYPLSDAMALRVTSAARSGFGSVRVFGSLGWVVFVPLGGQLVERLGLSFSLVGAGILTALSAGVLLFISHDHFSLDKEKIKAAPRPNLRAIFPRLMNQPMLLGLALMIVIIGFGNAGVWSFQTTYLNQLGAPASLIGVVGMFSAVVELPFMFFADYLMKRYSAYRLLLIGMLLYMTLRLMVFFFPSVPTIMLEQAMNGIGFTFYTIGIVRSISDQTASEGETRMMLAFFSVTLVNLTSIVSGPVAGSLFDRFGPHILYGIAALGYFLSWLALYTAARYQGNVKNEAAA
jgi:MFS transporter, PPP family, 3-phenylpropionic acid transporter